MYKNKPNFINSTYNVHENLTDCCDTNFYVVTKIAVYIKNNDDINFLFYLFEHTTLVDI